MLKNSHCKVVINMTTRCPRLLLILMLGVLLGACSSLDPKTKPKVPAPETESLPEQQSEQRTQPSEEQTAKRPESTPAQENKPPGDKPPGQEPGAPETAQTGEAAAAQTDDEVVVTLDRTLDEELRKYDEQIHEEFEKAQAQRRALEQPPDGEQEHLPGEVDGTGDGSGQGIETQTGPLAKTGPEQSEPGGPQDSQEERSHDSLGKGSHSMPPPIDIPSGDDDDVVARQLREAAQKEQDPVLREKLWDEYRKYKKQQASASTPPSGMEH